MFWPHWKYVEYVKKNAGPAGAQELLEPASEPVDPKFPNVLVTFRSMPDWMDWYDFTIDDDSFKLLLHRYRSQMRDYKEKLRRQFQPLTAGSVGPALLNELGGVNRVVKFRPYWNWLDPVDFGHDADGRHPSGHRGLRRRHRQGRAVPAQRPTRRRNGRWRQFDHRLLAGAVGTWRRFKNSRGGI